MAYVNQVITNRQIIPYRLYNGVGSYANNSVYADTTRTRSGQAVPNWREKIRSGVNAASPYTLEASKVIMEDALEMSAYYKQKPSPPYVGVQYPRILGYPGLSRCLSPTHIAVSQPRAEAASLTKVYSKLRSEFQHMNMPSVLAEIFDVLRQFGAPAAALVDLTNRRLNQLDLKKLGLSGSTAFRKIKYAEIIASTWLEYSFGLKPLISDTKKLAETLARWQLEEELPQLRKKVMGRGTDSARSVTGEFEGISPINNAVGAYRWQVDKKTEVRVQYTVGLQGLITADYGSNDRLLQLLGFDHANWLPGLYEAVPWSWLLDYFTNVNNILDAAVTNTGRIAWISKAVSTVTEASNAFILDTSKIDSAYLDTLYHRQGPWFKRGTGKGKVIRTTFQRTVPLSLSVPPLVIEHPFDNVKKVANMVAVLFKRKGNSALWIS